jgi:hypothetical protein
MSVRRLQSVPWLWWPAGALLAAVALTGLAALIWHAMTSLYRLPPRAEVCGVDAIDPPVAGAPSSAGRARHALSSGEIDTVWAHLVPNEPEPRFPPPRWPWAAEMDISTRGGWRYELTVYETDAGGGAFIIAPEPWNGRRPGVYLFRDLGEVLSVLARARARAEAEAARPPRAPEAKAPGDAARAQRPAADAMKGSGAPGG